MTKDALGIILPRFMKPIHIELSNKAVNFFVPKVLRQNNFLKLIDVLDNKLFASVSPKDDFRVFLILNLISKVL